MRNRVVKIRLPLLLLLLALDLRIYFVVFLMENTHQASKLNNQVAGQEHIAQVPSSEVTSYL